VSATTRTKPGRRSLPITSIHDWAIGGGCVGVGVQACHQQRGEAFGARHYGALLDRILPHSPSLLLARDRDWAIGVLIRRGCGGSPLQAYSVLKKNKKKKTKKKNEEKKKTAARADHALENGCS